MLRKNLNSLSLLTFTAFLISLGTVSTNAWADCHCICYPRGEDKVCKDYGTDYSWTMYGCSSRCRFQDDFEGCGALADFTCSPVDYKAGSAPEECTNKPCPTYSDFLDSHAPKAGEPGYDVYVKKKKEALKETKK